MLLKKLSLIVLISLINGCTSAPIAIPTVIPVQKAPVPILPALTPEQKNSIREDVFIILIQRELLLKEEIKLQDKLIDNHNNSSNPTIVK